MFTPADASPSARLHYPFTLHVSSGDKDLRPRPELRWVEFGWEELKLSRIVATVQEGNDVSTHILKKLGFELISTEPGPRSFLKFALNGPALV
jgi:hypothetical protein